MSMLVLRRSPLLALVVVAAFAGGGLARPTPTAAQAGTQGDLTAGTGQGTGRVLIAPTAEELGTFAVQITVNVHQAAPLTTFGVLAPSTSSPTASARGRPSFRSKAGA